MSLVAVIFAGCTAGGSSEKENLKNAAVEIACDVIKPMMEVDMTDEAAMAEAMASMADMEKKTEDIIKKYGFESMEAFEEAGNKYGEELQNEAKEAVKAKCNFDMDALDEMM